MKLINMTEFVLEQQKRVPKDLNLLNNYKLIINYAKFLSQPLTLSMFVPCDENGNPLEKPDPEHYGYLEGYGFEGQNGESSYNVDFRKYSQAEKQVLFEGFENGGGFGFNSWIDMYIDDELCENYKTIENLLNFGYNLHLTESAIKHIGL